MTPTATASEDYAPSLAHTLTGLGTTSGKYIMALGELVLRGFEAATIHSRIARLSFDLAPSSAAITDDRNYTELFDLTRNIYSTSTRRKALEVIILLIWEDTTGPLSRCLIQWSAGGILLLDIIRIMPADWITPIIENKQASSAIRLRTKLCHIQSPKSSLALHMMRFLLELSHVVQTADSDEEDGNDAVSFSSHVDASGKMILGPTAYLATRGTGSPIFGLVLAIICARLNRISVILALEKALAFDKPRSINVHAEYLEVFRSAAHPRGLRRQVKELLFISISSSYAPPLVQVLTTWSREEIRILLTQVMRWLRPFTQESCSASCVTPRAYNHYLSNHVNGEHPIVPFLFFLVRLCTANPLAAELCMDLDILRLLNTMCINNFPNPALKLNASARVNRTAISDVYSAIVMLFVALSSHPNSCKRLLQLEEIPRWFLSILYSSEFIGLPDSMLLQDMWLELEQPLLKLVLVSMEFILKRKRVTSNRQADFLPLREVYTFMVDILRANKSEPEVMYSASDSFLRCLSVGGEFSRVMDTVLAEGSLSDTRTILLNVVQSLGLSDLLPTTLVPASEPVLEKRPCVSDLKRAISQLAKAYTDELQMHTSLVAELIGSKACSARYTLIDIYQTENRKRITDDGPPRDAMGQTYPFQISSVQSVMQ